MAASGVLPQRHQLLEDAVEHAEHKQELAVISHLAKPIAEALRACSPSLSHVVEQCNEPTERAAE